MKIIRSIKDFICVLSGSVLFSVSVNVFSVPNNFVQGGLTGISIMLNSLFPALPVGTLIFIMNVPLLATAYFQLGKSFILKTATAVAASTAAIDALAPLLPQYRGDSFLASVFCGVFAGAGIGLIMLSGATTGGTEIAAILIKKRAAFISVGRLILIIDFCVIASSFFVFRSIEGIMYAVVAVFVSASLIDLIISGGVRNKMLLIITEKPKEISQAVFSLLGRGVTFIDVRGGFTGDKKSLVFCVVRASEVSSINRILPLTDENSFTVISDAGEVFGRGFR